MNGVEVALSGLAARADQVDQVTRVQCERTLAPLVPRGFALLAVGGYGRRQLFPCSDIDLLLLFESSRLAEGRREAIAEFLKGLWDSGLRVSHSVRTPLECCELDERNIELSVSLLDERFLTGDYALYARLAERLPRFVHAVRSALVRNLSRLARERHEKFQRTYYHLEPNVKDGPGGLRDYQLVRWLDRIRGGQADVDLSGAFDFLAGVRTRLHEIAGRDHNLLTFEAQERLTEDPAAWMRVYYRHARAVHRAALRALEAAEGEHSNLLAQFRDWRSRLSNADFTVSRERVHLRAPSQLAADTDLPLRLFRFVARHGLRLSPDAERRIAGHPVRAPWPALADLLSQPHTPLALRTMHETGALTSLLPELAPAECLVIRDFYHRYTVDEHSLVAIDRLWSLRGEQETFGGLLSEIESVAPVVFALLFHDLGKARPGAGHLEGSLAAAETAMERLCMPAPDRATVRFLIGRHLELSAVLQGRDLDDPATARDLASSVGTVERLKALTLVTWADISAVNPDAMTPWRAQQLWRLYLVTYNELTRELDRERIEASAQNVAFLEGFPTRYLRTHSEAEIAAHVQLAERSRVRGVAVDLEKANAGWRLSLVTSDRPYLLASIAGALAAFGMNILKVEAFGNRRGMVLDTFVFEDTLRTLELNPPELDRLRATVERAVLGKADVRKLLESRPRPRPTRLAGSVSLNTQASETATLIEVVAQDRPGLLHDLASAISSAGCNIELVLADTEAHKAVDVFYVTCKGAKPGPDDERRLRQALLEVTGPLETRDSR